MTTLEFAKYYVSKGLSVIPLKSQDKKPAIDSWKPYQSRLPSDEELTKWFGNGSNLNIGIVTGQISEIAVVDLDSKEAIQFAKEKFEKTPRVKSYRGYHLYFRYENGIRNFQKRDDLPNIDLRGEGGYIVAPPSVHPSGSTYEWVKGFGLDDIPLAILPDILLAKNSDDKIPLKELYKGVLKGKRNDTLARLAGSWVNDGLSLRDCTENAFMWNRSNNPPLPSNEVIETIKSIYHKHH